jgi:hypothetical protein
MARASPGSGSHPGNLLFAFFGAEREGPALPGVVPPRAGPRLLGGLLIAAMLHGVGVRPCSQPGPLTARQCLYQPPRPAIGIGQALLHLPHRLPAFASAAMGSRDVSGTHWHDRAFSQYRDDPLTNFHRILHR